MELSKAKLLQMYERMLTIRRFEEKVFELYTSGLMPGLAHLYIGEEAVAVGACAALNENDVVTSTHRGHGHLIAKGADIRRMMAEILGKATGYNRGKGGTMHIADIDLGILGAVGIVGGGFGIATGAALYAKMRKTGQVSLCFFGDGAVNQGMFHETLNLASLWGLPVVYVCENNLYALSVPLRKEMANENIAAKAAAYGLPGEQVDGQDVLAVYEAVSKAVNRARDGHGPTLIECRTYRYTGHHVGDPGIEYRTKEEINRWKRRDPIPIFEKKLRAGIASEDELASIRESVERLIEEAVVFAKQSPYPSVEEAGEDIYA